MKKYLAVLLVIVAILSISSCASLFPGKTEPTPSPTESASTGSSEAPSMSPSPTESAAAKFLAGEPTPAEIGKYLTQNASDLLPEDGDLLLERLLLAQLDVTLDMNIRIWDEAYMTALNDTLGGVLNADKIPDITDKTVRNDFQNVSDSLMTMVRYEETPVFEPDWAVLAAMEGTFSAQAGVMIEYQSRLQGRYYFGDPYNFDLAAADIVAVEQALRDTDIGFVRWQLEHLYTVQVGRLLYGPEGSYFSMFMSGDTQLVSNIENYANQYAATRFGTVCKNLFAKQGEGDQAVSDYISDSLIFPPGDSRRMSELKTDYMGAALQIPYISGINDATVMEKVNTVIMDAAKAHVKSGRNNQAVNSYISFVNSSYITLNFLYSYIDESNVDHYTDSFLMLNLKTGESVSLDDLTGQPFESYKDQLLKSMRGTDVPTDLNEPVNFSIDRTEMIISVPSAESDWPEYFTVTWNGLRSFMDVSQLY